MLTVNNKEHPFHEGMSVQTLMSEKGFVFHRIIVRLNGKVIEKDSYRDTVLHDGDVVDAIHVFAGG